MIALVYCREEMVKYIYRKKCVPRGNTKHSILNRKVHSHIRYHTGYHQSAIGITPSLPLIPNSLYIKYKQHKYFSNNKNNKLENKNKTLKVMENISILFSPISSCFHNIYSLSVFRVV